MDVSIAVGPQLQLERGQNTMHACGGGHSVASGGLPPANGQVGWPPKWLVELTFFCKHRRAPHFAAGCGGFGQLEGPAEPSLLTTGLPPLPRLSPCHL